MSVAEEHDRKACRRGFEVEPLARIEGTESAVAIAHHEDHSFTLGTVRPVAPDEKAPPGAVLVEHKGGGVYGRAPLEHSGPAQVASDAYRAGWGRIFGGNKNPEVGQA